jgi:hypothetical protein
MAEVAGDDKDFENDDVVDEKLLMKTDPDET